MACRHFFFQHFYFSLGFFLPVITVIILSFKDRVPVLFQLSPSTGCYGNTTATTTPWPRKAFVIIDFFVWVHQVTLPWIRRLFLQQTQPMFMDTDQQLPISQKPSMGSFSTCLYCFVRCLIPTKCRTHMTSLTSEIMHHVGAFLLLFTESAARETVWRVHPPPFLLPPFSHSQMRLPRELW